MADTATPAREAGRRSAATGFVLGREGFAGQLTLRMNPQMLQVATPVRESNSRKLGQPLVPQKSLELTEAAVDRRRIRRIADARPVTDDVAERVIMVK